MTGVQADNGSAFHTVDAVEQAAGLSLFDDVTKAGSRELCRTVKCDIIIRRFDDAQKKVQGGGNRSRRGSVSAA